jgi:hypothetical protein
METEFFKKDNANAREMAAKNSFRELRGDQIQEKGRNNQTNNNNIFLIHRYPNDLIRLVNQKNA